MEKLGDVNEGNVIKNLSYVFQLVLPGLFKYLVTSRISNRQTTDRRCRFVLPYPGTYLRKSFYLYLNRRREL
ncbi:hypothetical protein CS542_00065 [Pedobacter sp. IW39]|nr:hypothetical protein CS542_00065 [Pedobacter sp. IW39]